MSKVTRLIFALDDAGKLKMTFTGAAIDGADKLDLDFATVGKNPWNHLAPQIMTLSTPTGNVELEFPNEDIVRTLACQKSKIPEPA